MKKIVLIVTVVCLSFIGYIFVAGFWDKQQLEKKATTRQASQQSSYTGSTNSSSSTEPNSNTGNNGSTTKSFALSEVAQHSNSKDCWLAINGKVYDVTKYIYDHPGGASEIIDTCGTDATVAFKTMNRPGNKTHSSSANQMLADYFIGNLK
ncbi:cytochrome b5 domain-containing protein [Candidatus Saccharibacteria bacterium]|nr:cytochrome b5 domain-containing protein [Candidatus Saccharibacteria bacterium]